MWIAESFTLCDFIATIDQQTLAAYGKTGALRRLPDWQRRDDCLASDAVRNRADVSIYVWSG
jgi:hypothetical protein